MALESFAAVVPENSIRFLGHDTHSHAEPHLVHAALGTASLVVDGTPIELRTKESVWIAPHVPHSARVGTDGVLLGPLLDAHVVPPGRFRVLGVVPAVSDVMAATLGASPATPDQVRPFRTALGEVLLRLGRRYFPVAQPTTPAVRELAREAVASHRTLEQLARAHHVSARQVQRVFLDETGLPFASWRARSRLNVAVALLLSGETEKRAALAAGYTSRSSLLRALGREAGIPLDELSAAPVAALERHSPAV